MDRAAVTPQVRNFGTCKSGNLERSTLGIPSDGAWNLGEFHPLSTRPGSSLARVARGCWILEARRLRESSEPESDSQISDRILECPASHEGPELGISVFESRNFGVTVRLDSSEGPAGIPWAKAREAGRSIFLRAGSERRRAGRARNPGNPDFGISAEPPKTPWNLGISEFRMPPPERPRPPPPERPRPPPPLT